MAPPMPLTIFPGIIQFAMSPSSEISMAPSTAIDMAQNAEIEKLRQECAKIGKPFIYNQNEEQDDEEKQFASFFFIGKDNGREVIFDTYMSTLSYEYHMNVLDEAEGVFFEKHPELQETDFFELDEKHQAEYDKIVDGIYAEDKIRVQEDALIYEEEEEDSTTLGMEVFLHKKEITEEVIIKFIKDFNADTFEPSEDLYSFAQEGNE